MLHTKKPREQSGRDSFSRYKAQIRSAGIASLSILEGNEIDRVYCDLHDDFVIRKKDEHGFSYIFYQVKTKGKQNHNWSVSDIFGLQPRAKKQDPLKIRDSFIGKLLLHTVVFDCSCHAIVFQTNINNTDDVDELLADIATGTFKDKNSEHLISNFNLCFANETTEQLSTEKIKSNLSKLKFETDVQYLKIGNDNFEPIARDKIYKFSEVDLSYLESKEILIKLLDLVEKKSSGVIHNLSIDSIEKYAAISIDDLLPILSISKEAYDALLLGGDRKAIKNASIIQRTLSSAGAGDEEIEYCSRCKTNWDIWLRNNRHIISELDLQTIKSHVTGLLNNAIGNKNSLKISELRQPIKVLENELKSQSLLYDLDINLILGAVFAELVKAKS
ncbi:dsDNA nuclease domain-containing protein [Aeromonas veronii]|uniref:dsDNA nuclease domain-containing protein n=1 Tax=Aeromonas veronii TaxID=654 RepID=UPI003D233280